MTSPSEAAATSSVAVASIGDNAFAFRTACQGFVALGFYCAFWLLLVLSPIILAVALFFMPTPEVSDHAFTGFGFVLVYAIFVLIGLLARWLARGILQASKGRTILAALTILLVGMVQVGTGYVFLAANSPSNQIISTIGSGLVSLLVGVCLLSTLLPHFQAK